MATVTELARNYEFLIQPANGDRSFEEVTVAAGGADRLGGTVLGKLTAGTVGAAAAQSGNTGNATVSTVTKGVNVKSGTYNIEFVSATEFILIDPTGAVVGNGQTGTAFSDGAHLSFTITAGGTAMVAGDGFTVAVALGNGDYVPYDAAATNGAATVAGILLMDIASGVTAKRAIVARDATVKNYKLIYTGTEATVVAGLAALGIIAR